MAKKPLRASPPKQVTAQRAAPSRFKVGLAALLGLGIGALAFAGGWYFLRRPGWHVERRLDQNVLLITIDTLRADALGCYGGRTATPNLDRLASLGLRFDFAHAHAVITLPAHASILTGFYPPQHGIRDNSGFRLPADIPTLAVRLKPHRFATAAFVGAFPVDSRFGLNAGFDAYDDHYPGTSESGEFNLPERRAEAVVEPARRWIAAQQDRWFVWVHVFDPHAPYAPPAPFDTQYAAEPYLGEVAYTDHALAPLLETATASLSRPTLIVVTGDHGEALGDHGEATHGLFAYEATLRVPLILAQVGAGTAPWGSGATGSPAGGRGRIVSTPVRHVDVVPTILDILTLPVPADLPGRSLEVNGALAPDSRAPSYFEALSASLNRGWAPLTGVLADRDKYIELPLPELYDLGTDPREANNLVDRQPDRRAALESQLRRFPAGAPSTGRTQDPEAAARLRALGYVTGSAAPKARYTGDDDPKRLIGVDQAIRRGIETYQQRGPRDAVPIFQQVISSRPTLELAYLYLAMLQWEIGEPSAAIATLRAGLRAGVQGESLRARLGVYLAESGSPAEALPLLQEVASGEFPDLDALNALGIALQRSGRTKEAVETFNRILRLNPSNAMALENLGSIALAQGRLDEARHAYSLALESDPTSTQANNGMGVVEMRAGHRKVAIEYWTKAVARDPQNYDALYNVATELVADGRPAEARPYLERFVQTAPPSFYASDIRRLREMLGRIPR